MSRQSMKDRYDSAKQKIRRDPLTLAIVKSTTEEEIPPKEKHLLALEVYTRNTFTPMPDFVNALKQRLAHTNFLVVAKTVMTIHYLLINGEERFALYLTTNMSILDNLFNFPPEVMQQNENIINFLTSYSLYLKTKLEIYFRLGFDTTKAANSLKFEDKNVRDLVSICKNFSTVSKSLFHTEIHQHKFSSKMLLFIFHLIYVDSSRLYCCYNSALSVLFKQFYSTDKDTAQSIYNEFEDYQKHQNEYKLLFDLAKELLNLNQGIEVTLIDNSVFEKMKNYISQNQTPKSLLTMEEKPQKTELEELFQTDSKIENNPMSTLDELSSFKLDADLDLFGFENNVNVQPQSLQPQSPQPPSSNIENLQQTLNSLYQMSAPQPFQQMNPLYGAAPQQMDPLYGAAPQQMNPTYGSVPPQMNQLSGSMPRQMNPMYGSAPQQMNPMYGSVPQQMNPPYGAVPQQMNPPYGAVPQQTHNLHQLSANNFPPMSLANQNMQLHQPGNTGSNENNKKVPDPFDFIGF